MPDTKISDLTSGNPPQDADEFPIRRTTGNNKLSWLNLRTALASLFAPAFTTAQTTAGGTAVPALTSGGGMLDADGNPTAVRSMSEVRVRNSAGTSLGGIRQVGSVGEMALTSQIDPNSSQAAEVVRYYWDGAAIGSQSGSASVLRGMGTNRFSIESVGAMIHISGTGRYEWEGTGSARLSWVSYEAGSSLHRPIDINLTGTSDDGAPKPLLSISGTTGRTNDLLQFCSLNSAVYTLLARFDSTGKLFAPGADVSGQILTRNHLAVTDGNGENGFSLWRESSGGVMGAAVYDQLGNVHVPIRARHLQAVPRVFSQLPAASSANGAVATITDCNTSTAGANAAGGGSITALVWANGVNWKVVMT